MSFQLKMHHFLWISHQFWVSPLLTLRSACVLMRENSLPFLQEGGLMLVWSSFFATHTHCGRWVHENFSSSWALHWAWCFAMGLVLCAGAWCKPLHHRFFHLRPINAPKQIACLCETFLGIIKLLWRSNYKERIFTLLVIVNSIIIDHNQHQHIMIIPTWAAPLLLHIFERKARPRPGIRISFKRFTSNHLQMLLLLAYLFHFIAPITKYVVLLIGTQLPSWSSHWYEPKYQEKISFLVLTLSILESPSSRSHTALHCHYLCDCSL